MGFHSLPRLIMARIQLHNDYRGRRSGERVIPAGVYDLTDASLFGIGEYLVESGHAARLDGHSGTTVVTAPDGTTVTTTTTISHNEFMTAEGRTPIVPQFPQVNPAPDYDSESVDGLKEEAERRGIDLSGVAGSGKDGRLLKADLIAVLEGYDRDQGGWTVEQWAEWDAARVARGQEPWARVMPGGTSMI